MTSDTYFDLGPCILYHSMHTLTWGAILPHYQHITTKHTCDILFWMPCDIRYCTKTLQHTLIAKSWFTPARQWSERSSPLARRVVKTWRNSRLAARPFENLRGIFLSTSTTRIRSTNSLSKSSSGSSCRNDIVFCYQKRPSYRYFTVSWCPTTHQYHHQFATSNLTLFFSAFKWNGSIRVDIQIQAIILATRTLIWREFSPHFGKPPWHCTCWVDPCTAFIRHSRSRRWWSHSRLFAGQSEYQVARYWSVAHSGSAPSSRIWRRQMHRTSTAR